MLKFKSQNSLNLLFETAGLPLTIKSWDLSQSVIIWKQLRKPMISSTGIFNQKILFGLGEMPLGLPFLFLFILFISSVLINNHDSSFGHIETSWSFQSELKSTFDQRSQFWLVKCDYFKSSSHFKFDLWWQVCDVNYIHVCVNYDGGPSMRIKAPVFLHSNTLKYILSDNLFNYHEQIIQE